MQSWTETNSVLRESVIRHINADIVCLSETHFMNNAGITMADYHWFSNNRNNIHRRARTGSGGCGILVKHSVYQEFDICTVKNDVDGILCVKFSNKFTDYSFVVYSTYLPPEYSTRGRDAVTFFADVIADIYLNSDCDAVVLCGDLNARVGNLIDYVPNIDSIPGRDTLDTVKNSHGDCFIEFLKDGKLCVLNGRVTPENNDFTFISHQGKSVVDYIAVNHEALCKFSYFDVLTMSDCIEKFDLFSLLSQTCKAPDHSVLVAKMSHMLTNTTNINTAEPHSCTCQHMNECKRNKYRKRNIPEQFMSSLDWKTNISHLIEHYETQINNQQDLDTSYKLFTDTLFSEMDKFLKINFSSKKVRKQFKSHKPYWNETLSELWLKMRDAEKAFIACKSLGRIKKRLYNDFKDRRHIFNKELRKQERAYYRGIAIEIDKVETSDPRQFWKYIQSLGPKRHHEIPMKVYIDEDNNIATDVKTVLQKWKNDFACLYNKPGVEDEQTSSYNSLLNLKLNLEHDTEQLNHTDKEAINGTITYDELHKVISKLKQNKATGLDEIPNEVLKYEDIEWVLLIYFNKCFSMGLIPTVWLKAVIVPVPKGSTKDPCVPLNYRGISLLSCVYKVYSGILNSRLVNYMEDIDWFVEEQNGFRGGRSCQDHIFSLTSLIRNRLSVKKHTYVAFVDMQKAFDWVDRDLLLLKLLINNIDGNLYRSIKSMYSDTLSAVRINGMCTDWFQCNSGVRQGDVLSTTLFSIYINDLAKEIKDLNLGIPVFEQKVSILLYADDIALIAENEEELQLMLNKLSSWCDKWRMKVNQAKTNIIDFRPKRSQRSDFKFHIGGVELNTVEQYKYLGVVFNEYLDFNVTAEILSDAGGRALGAIIGKTKHIKDLGYNTFNRLFQAGVKPILEYGSEIWGYKPFTHTDNIQNRAARYFLGVHRFTPILALRGELGWYTTQKMRWLNMFRYWNRLINMPENRLTKCIFEWDWVKCKDNWSSELRELYTQFDSQNTFFEKTLCDLDLLTSKVKEYDQDIWLREIQQKPKLRTYIQFKDNLKPEKYVCSSIPRYQRSIMASLRSGILPLKIETGRYESIPADERICELCCSGDIENEVHFLCSCSFYKDLREQFYRRFVVDTDLETLSINEIFIYLMTSRQTQTAKFCWDIFCKRRVYIYNR